MNTEFTGLINILNTSGKYMGTSGIVAIFGGSDLTYKWRTTLQEMCYILADDPSLIELVPAEHCSILVEYARVNYSPAYDAIIPFIVYS